MRLQSYLAGAWQSGEGRASLLRDASTGAVVAESASEGLDFAGGAAPRARGRRAGPARADLPRTRRDPARARQAAARLQAGVLRALAPHRRDEGRLLDRHRRRHRHDAGFREQGFARTPEQPRLPRRRARGTLAGRNLRRPAHLRAARGRRRAHQCVQLPGVGNAREARAGIARRRAGDREARDCHELPDGARRAAHRRDRHPAARCAAAHLRRRRRPVRPPRLPGRRFLHRVGRDGGEASHAPCGRAAQRALRRGDGLAQFFHPRPGRRARNARVRALRPGSRARDDREGRAEVHGDPQGAGAAGDAGRSGRGAPGEAGRDRRRRPARRGRRHGAAREPCPARRGARARRRSRTRVRADLGRSGGIRTDGRQPPRGRFPAPDPAPVPRRRKGARRAFGRGLRSRHDRDRVRRHAGRDRARAPRARAASPDPSSPPTRRLRPSSSSGSRLTTDASWS